MATVTDIAVAVAGASTRGDPETVVSGVTHDSRQVKPGYIFAVLRGDSVDGRDFVKSAIERGAAALLVEEFLDVDVAQIHVDDLRESLGAVAAACYGDPTSHLSVVGITGTNGKTTTVYLVEAALTSVGASPGVMTTVEYRVGDRIWKADHTTPEATVVQSTAAKILDANASHLILEASSHGLSLGRLKGCQFDVVAFSNLTQDHLDFHRNMEDYGAAKLRLFTEAIADSPEALAVVNLDDGFAPKILKALRHPVLTVSVDPQSKADVRPSRSPTFDIDGIFATIRTPAGEHTLRSPLIGPHNLSNLLLTLGICIQLGIKPEDTCLGLGKLAKVPGRLERVSGADDFAVFVDYAHTPDALEWVLKSLRPLTRGRLMCVFGCGGDRDQSKRPIMGQVVGECADIVLVTSDNPRTEDPVSILDMIAPGVVEAGISEIHVSGLNDASSGYVVISDRAAAIEAAISNARSGDTILIAGKGHEDYQILGTKKIHFDDREEAATAIGVASGRHNG